MEANGVDRKPTITHKYPSFRDEPVKSTHRWLEGRRLDDNAEGLWRIYDKLYDLTDFIERHPGGEDWLKYTKGLDITEFFETHHLSGNPEKLLPKYYVRDASQPRNFKFTFNENGFYKTLKRRAAEKMKTVDKRPAEMSKIINDVMVVIAFATAILAMRLNSYIIGIVSGIFVTFSAIVAHNFFHQKDNFRMYYFNLSMLNFRDWRISHALSHHIYTNTFHDLEISMFEPFLCYLPESKSFVKRYISWIYTPIMYSLIYHMSFFGRVAKSLATDQLHFFLDDLIALTVPLAMYFFGRPNIFEVLTMWALIIASASFSFGVIGLNAGHHHPESSHEGDELCKSMDFGIFQMDAVIDRNDLKVSQLLVLTHFGEHTMHHLFPTIDHGILPQLYDVFYETCRDFELELKEYPWYKLIIGQFQQLARTQPKTLKEKGRDQ